MKRALLIGGSVVIVVGVIVLICWRHQPSGKKESAEEPKDTALTVKAVSGSSSVLVGEYRQFVAEQNGKEVEVEWKVSNPQLACVDETGIVVGTHPGLFNVVATHKGISGQARVQVVTASVADVRPPRAAHPAHLEAETQPSAIAVSRPQQPQLVTCLKIYNRFYDMEAGIPELDRSWKRLQKVSVAALRCSGIPTNGMISYEGGGWGATANSEKLVGGHGFVYYKLIKKSVPLPSDIVVPPNATDDEIEDLALEALERWEKAHQSQRSTKHRS